MSLATKGGRVNERRDEEEVREVGCGSGQDRGRDG